MESIIQVLIFIHATFGAIALLSGCIAIIAKKGKKAHRVSGLTFFYTMLTSGLVAMLIAVLPNHESPFLFSIGIFSMYFIISGKRALNFKMKGLNLKVDKCISVTMLLTGVLMVFLPLIINKSVNIILAVFGVVGVLFSIRDLQLFNKPEYLAKKWLHLHIGKILGGYTSALTAFIVVANVLPGIYGWFAPSLVGGSLTIYWIRKINRAKKST